MLLSSSLVEALLSTRREYERKTQDVPVACAAKVTAALYQGRPASSVSTASGMMVDTPFFPNDIDKHFV